MSFEDIIGQERVKHILERSVQSGKLPHAFLFHGPDGTGKLATALALAKIQFCSQDALYCNNCSDCKRVDHLNFPDLRIIFPAKKEYSQDYARSVIDSIAEDPYLYARIWQNEGILIDRIREEIIKWVNLKSLENKGKVVILIDAHRLKEEAANSILKILEEPPPKVMIILLTAKPEKLLPTIISRCHHLRFDPIPWEKIRDALIRLKGISEPEATVAARMSFGNYRRAAELLSEDLSEKQDLMLDMLRKILSSDLEIITFGEKISATFDNRTLVEILELMTIWFHDAMIYEHLNEQVDSSGKLIFADRKEILRKFIDSFEAIPYDKIFQKIDLTITMINQYVNARLAILNLLYELKRLLRRKLNV